MQEGKRARAQERLKAVGRAGAQLGFCFAFAFALHWLVQDQGRGGGRVLPIKDASKKYF